MPGAGPRVDWRHADPRRGLPARRRVSPRVQVVETHRLDERRRRAPRVRGPPAEWPHLSLAAHHRPARRTRPPRPHVDDRRRAPRSRSRCSSVSPHPAGGARMDPARRRRRHDARRRSSSCAAAGTPPRLKWPNDVLSTAARSAASSRRSCRGPRRRRRSEPASTPGCRAPTSRRHGDLVRGAGLEPTRTALLADYLAALDEQLTALAAADGDAAAAGVLGEVEALCTTIGARCRRRSRTAPSCGRGAAHRQRGPPRRRAGRRGARLGRRRRARALSRRPRGMRHRRRRRARTMGG